MPFVRLTRVFHPPVRKCSRELLTAVNNIHLCHVGIFRGLQATKLPPRVRLVSIATVMASHSNELKDYLAHSKEKYLTAVKDQKGREWTVAMGNEAGGQSLPTFKPGSLLILYPDLDSLASSIALAWYMNTVLKDPTVALIQTSRADLPLRPENLYALELAGLTESTQHLLCSDDIDDVPSSPFPSSLFALLDHNRLQSRFTQDNSDAKVVAIIDHHEDEGAHQESADPRIVTVPTGSCASLVARYISERSPDTIPEELATLLLCAILIDTNGLKPGGKAEDADREAAVYLTSCSVLAPGGSVDPSNPHEDPRLKDLTETLREKKSDVSDLDTSELLRRDYKEYTMTPSWVRDKTILVGLSSIPIGLDPWVSEDKQFWQATEQYMTERNLSVLGMLTSFKDDTKLNKHGKPKHRREQLYVVYEGEIEGLADVLFKGLKHSKELDLKKRSLADDYHTEVPSAFLEKYQVKVWKQGNTDASRKITAPLVKQIIEG